MITASKFYVRVALVKVDVKQIKAPVRKTTFFVRRNVTKAPHIVVTSRNKPLKLL